jgi:hypothetical protein
MLRIMSTMGTEGVIRRVATLVGNNTNIFRFAEDIGWFSWYDLSKRDLYLDKYPQYFSKYLDDIPTENLILQMGNYYRKKKDKK